MRKFVVSILILVLVAIIVVLSDPFKNRIGESDVIYYTSESISYPPEKDTLLVMTWNIKFGGARINFFFDCFGKRSLMTGQEVMQNLGGIGDFVSNTRPDILFIQEVDRDSKRSAFVDQVQWLLNNTHLNYAVYAPQWKSLHIPSDSLGKMNSGLAILSRWPLQEAGIISLPRIKKQNFILKYFYLRRCVLECKTVINGKPLVLLTTHTEPYAKDGTKKNQLEKIFSHLQKLDSLKSTFIIGGDFNALPPGTLITRKFPDSVCDKSEFDADDYSGETLWMEPFYHHFNAAVPLMEYQADNSKFFTHTVDGNGYWNRKLDYLFTNADFVPGSHITYQSTDNGGYYTIPLSDHCAISVKFVMP